MLAMTRFDTVPACVAAEFQRHVNRLLTRSTIGTLDELVEDARWFVASTAGPDVTLRPALLQAFFHEQRSSTPLRSTTTTPIRLLTLFDSAPVCSSWAGSSRRTRRAFLPLSGGHLTHQ
jgi:hypothetical protein